MTRIIWRGGCRIHYLRKLGSVGYGRIGAPLGGGFDMEKNGHSDYVFAPMRASPHDNPAGRDNADTLHIVLGKSGRWTALSNLHGDNYPTLKDVQIHEIYGAKLVDMLCYSVAAGDVSGDGYFLFKSRNLDLLTLDREIVHHRGR